MNAVETGKQKLFFLPDTKLRAAIARSLGQLVPKSSFVEAVGAYTPGLSGPGRDVFLLHLLALSDFAASQGSDIAELLRTATDAQRLLTDGEVFATNRKGQRFLSAVEEMLFVLELAGNQLVQNAKGAATGNGPPSTPYQT